jgi:hypothetical protein
MARLYDTGIFSANATNGSIGVGYKLNFYTTETATRKATYPTRADALAATNANANPVVAGADGRFGPIWLASGDYKAVLTDASDNVLATLDPADNNIEGTAQTLTAKLTTLASATSGAGLNLPHGAAPTSPVNGDFWSTTGGIYGRVNGATFRCSLETAAGNIEATTGVYGFDGPVTSRKSSSATNQCYIIHDGSNGYVISSANSLYLSANGVTQWFISTTALAPVTDNAEAIGGASNRATEVFAATGTINTSDEREKQWRGALSVAELDAAKRICAELGFYQWLDAIAEKGADGARYHFGVRAQRAFAILEDAGLDWHDYAWCCYDEWGSRDAVDATVDDKGNVLVPARPSRAAGSRYGIRTDQLALFLIAAQEQRLAALEDAA